MPAAARLRYLEALPSGTDRPRGTLVLSHAFPLNARMWEPQLAIANHGWRVVAPQLRGVDGDQNPPASSVDEYAGEVIDLMDALDSHEAVIGGLSMGGYVTLAMFRHAPRYFLGMILPTPTRRPIRPRAPRAANGCCGWSTKGASAIADEMLPASERRLAPRSPRTANGCAALFFWN
jgi:pimeloyl-ACP methyl ester carboxylesterase